MRMESHVITGIDAAAIRGQQMRVKPENARGRGAGTGQRGQGEGGSGATRYSVRILMVIVISCCFRRELK